MRVPHEVRFQDFDPPVTSSGAWSGNTPLLGGYLVGIRVRPTTASTQYDLTLVDKDSNTVFERKLLKGGFQSYIANGPIPLRSIVTVSLANATVDEAFTELTLILDP